MPASTRRQEGRPKSVGKKSEAQMRKRGEAGPQHIDAARRHAVGERDQHRDHDDVSCEEDTNQPAGFDRRKRPALDVAGQQRRQGEGAELRQHLRGNDRPRVTMTSRFQPAQCHSSLPRPARDRALSPHMRREPRADPLRGLAHRIVDQARVTLGCRCLRGPSSLPIPINLYQQWYGNQISGRVYRPAHPHCGQRFGRHADSSSSALYACFPLVFRFRTIRTANSPLYRQPFSAMSSGVTMEHYP